MLLDRSSEPMMQLLVDATRRAANAGASLAQAHRDVGRHLADAVVAGVPLVETPIEHPTGRSSGVSVQQGAEPIVVAMMRSGLFVAEGIWAAIPGSSLVLHDTRLGSVQELPARGRTVVVVDAVINTGATLERVLREVSAMNPARLVVAALVAFRPTVERLVSDHRAVDFVFARISDRSYVGAGTTDTGARLFGTTTWAKEQAATQGASKTLRAAAASATAASSSMRSLLEGQKAPSDPRKVLRELSDMNFERMSNDLARCVASEFAARARSLRERGNRDVPDQVIKKLTTIAQARKLGPIRGLKHQDKGDWDLIAREARRDRDDIESRATKPISSKLVVPPEVKKKVEAKPQPNVQKAEVEIEHLPKLQVASRRKPVVLVGGLVENGKLDWIKAHYGFVPEWIETDNTVKGVQNLEGRILDGNVTAVVILEGLISHKHFDPLIKATRQTGTPLAYGDTAGTGSLRKAFVEVEGMLGG